jgi:hypothetical protein
MAEPEIVYCDDYEAITGKSRGEVETKVVPAPVTPSAKASEVDVETKAAE